MMKYGLFCLSSTYKNSAVHLPLALPEISKLTAYPWCEAKKLRVSL